MATFDMGDTGGADKGRVWLACAARFLALLSLAMAVAANAAPPLSKPNDRSSLFEADTAISNDLRRVPVAPGTHVPDGAIVILNARLFDGTGAPARNATLLIEGDRLTRILPTGSRDFPSNAQIIDAAGRTVMPGLIDLHTHLTYVRDPASPDGGQGGAVIRGTERLRYFVESGITSVRDLGSDGMAPFQLKEEVAAGRIPGPRIFAAGQLIVGRGGHGTEHPLQKTAPEFQDAPIREASGPDNWRDAVRANFKRGADLIKVASHFSQDEIEAAVDEAHRLGLRVTVDSESIYTAMAVAAGVDSVEHPLPRDDETIRAMAAKKIAAVPTFVPYQYINAKGGYKGSTSRRFTISDKSIFDMGVKLRAAGIKLGVGTDLILGWHRYLPDAYIQELRNLQRLGYSAPDALVAATKTNAEILGMDDRLGTLQSGKLADLVIVDGEPDQDIEDLKNVEIVIVGGRVVVRDGAVSISRHKEEVQPLSSAEGAKQD
jgi:imidazolonepropionase-like amidohydrolase